VPAYSSAKLINAKKGFIVQTLAERKQMFETQIKNKIS
jgi:hypothetical protein